MSLVESAASVAISAFLFLCYPGSHAWGSGHGQGCTSHFWPDRLNEREQAPTPVENEMNDHSDSVMSLVAIVVIIWAVGCFCGTLISASIILSILQHP